MQPKSKQKAYDFVVGNSYGPLLKLALLLNSAPSQDLQLLLHKIIAPFNILTEIVNILGFNLKLKFEFLSELRAGMSKRDGDEL